MTWGPCTAHPGLTSLLACGDRPSRLPSSRACSGEGPAGLRLHPHGQQLKDLPGASTAALRSVFAPAELLPKCVLHVQTLTYLGLQEPGPLGLP